MHRLIALAGGPELLVLDLLMRGALAQVLYRAEVGGLLAMLSMRQRAMMIAEYYLDLDQEEIARIFGVQRGTVAATLAQARARMRTGGQDVS